MRRYAFSIAVVAAMVTPCAAGAQAVAPADAIVGTWQADDASVKLNLYRTGAEYQARLLWGDKVVEADRTTFKLDLKNPDPMLRMRSLRNIVFIRGLRRDGAEWGGGSLYDGSSGRTYRCKVTMKDGRMYLRGYIGMPALGRTQGFHRVAE